MAIRITCIKKDKGNHENPYTAILSMNWVDEADGKTGTNSRVEIYDWIKEKGGIAYVKDRYGNKANLQTRITDKGTKYVRTKPDGTTSDNLLELPEC